MKLDLHSWCLCQGYSPRLTLPHFFSHLEKRGDGATLLPWAVDCNVNRKRRESSGTVSQICENDISVWSLENIYSSLFASCSPSNISSPDSVSLLLFSVKRNPPCCLCVFIPPSHIGCEQFTFLQSHGDPKPKLAFCSGHTVTHFLGWDQHMNALLTARTIMYSRKLLLCKAVAMEALAFTSVITPRLSVKLVQDH